jgi:hypothetical protein
MLVFELVGSILIRVLVINRCVSAFFKLKNKNAENLAAKALQKLLTKYFV